MSLLPTNFDFGFRNKMSDALQSAFPFDLGLNKFRVEQALNNVNMFQLSVGERDILLNVANMLTADGFLSAKDANALIHMLKEFSSNGSNRFNDAWPFPDINLDKMPGSPLFNGSMGFISDCLGKGMNDFAFLRTADRLLEHSDGNLWTEALKGAFHNADLSKLNPFERSELLCMLSAASADGKVNWAEARCIMDKLDKAQGCHPFPDFPLPCPPKTDSWSVQQEGSGRATIDLGKYELKLNENSSEMILTNKETGESSRIWGDPHFDMNNDGKTDVDFWGTMSLNLEDGTKITIQTTPYDNNPNMTLSSRLVITNGDNAIVVNGLDQNHKGDMNIEMSQNGRLLDTFTGDGLNVFENPNGTNWLVRDGLSLREVTQADMDKTKNTKSDFSLLESLKAMSTLFCSGFLMGLILDGLSLQDR